jgi:hypothetical protein
MNRLKTVSVVAAVAVAAILLGSSITLASPVVAKTNKSADGSSSGSSGGSSSGSSGSSGGSSSGSSGGSSSGGSSSSSSSSKAGYDTFQKCLSDAASGGSATKSQIRTCFDSTYGAGGSSGSGSSGSGSSGSGSSGSGSSGA